MCVYRLALVKLFYPPFLSSLSHRSRHIHTRGQQQRILFLCLTSSDCCTCCCHAAAAGQTQEGSGNFRFFFLVASCCFFVHHPSFECEITGIVAKHWHETGITYITLGLVCLLALLPVGSRRERNTLTRAEGWCTGWCCDWSVMERHVSWVTAGWFDFSIWFGWERRRTDGGKKRKGGRLVKKQGKFRQSISGKTSQKYTRVYSKQKLSC